MGGFPRMMFMSYRIVLSLMTIVKHDVPLTLAHLDEARIMGDALYREEPHYRKRVLPYHNKSHWDAVAQHAMHFANANGDDESSILLHGIAGYLHDLGFYGPLARYVGHEDASVDYARILMRSSNLEFSQEDADRLCDAILNTRCVGGPKPPSNDLERHLRDADLYSVGHYNFLALGEAYREELLANPDCGHPDIAMAQLPNRGWYAMQLQFLENHAWHSQAARDYVPLQRKQENIWLVKGLLGDLKAA